MATTETVLVRITTDDGSSNGWRRDASVTITPSVSGDVPKVEVVTASVGVFQALTIPSYATAVCIRQISGNATSVKLKGITGDTGITMNTTVNAGAAIPPVVIPLGGGSLGLLAAGADAVFEVTWL